jgi:hypothetical protein
MKIIKACQIKPGMVICFKRNGKFNDFCLVTAVRGKTKVEYTHLDFQDSYGGLLVGTIDGSEKVKVVEGDQRKHILSKIKDDVFQYLHDVENIINTLNLIEAMGEKK